MVFKGIEALKPSDPSMYGLTDLYESDSTENDAAGTQVRNLLHDQSSKTFKSGVINKWDNFHIDTVSRTCTLSSPTPTHHWGIMKYPFNILLFSYFRGQRIYALKSHSNVCIICKLVHLTNSKEIHIFILFLAILSFYSYYFVHLYKIYGLQ